MEIKKRHSPKRDAILDNLKNRVDHPIAAMVHESIKEVYPNISLATVYRNLNELSNDGKILSFVSDGVEHFDGNITPHYHFCCNECGNIFDIFDDSVNTVAESMISHLNCEISSMKITATGRCKECINKHSNVVNI